jgi:hypothetical protein
MLPKHSAAPLSFVLSPSTFEVRIWVLGMEELHVKRYPRIMFVGTLSPS